MIVAIAVLTLLLVLPAFALFIWFMWALCGMLMIVGNKKTSRNDMKTNYIMPMDACSPGRD